MVLVSTLKWAIHSIFLILQSKYAYPHITGKKKKETFSLNLHNWYLLELESEPISL